MPRLTAELIADSPQFTNPVKDWELDLRGMNWNLHKSQACQISCVKPPFIFEFETWKELSEPAEI